MHPYEMAATLRQRHKKDSIKLRYGSLYTLIDLLVARGLISAKTTSRAGQRGGALPVPRRGPHDRQVAAVEAAVRSEPRQRVIK